jgi:hypothetical protein
MTTDVPDLMATLPDAPPVPDREVSSWSMTAMSALLEAQDRRAAWGSARLAALYQRQGRPHLDVMLALAGAEMHSSEADRPFHADRLDAYAAAYGLSGWYRGTASNGRPYVQVNRLRTAAEGNAGRYFTHHADDYLNRADGAFWVVDRDTGLTAHQARSAKQAAAWIEDNGG